MAGVMHVRTEPILLVALKLHAPHEVTSCAPGQSYTPATNIEDGRCDACADGTYLPTEPAVSIIQY